MLLVGDPKQLRPFSKIQGDNSFHSRSLMERAIDDGLNVHFLNEQVVLGQFNFKSSDYKYSIVFL
jgi:hypothetical protein